MGVCTPESPPAQFCSVLGATARGTEPRSAPSSRLDLAAYEAQPSAERVCMKLGRTACYAGARVEDQERRKTGNVCLQAP